MFETKLQSLQSISKHNPPTESQIRLISEAAELYSGDFLEGFYIHDASAFEEWVVLQREHLRHLQLAALHVLAKHYTAQGAYAAGITYASRLLELEPWHEEFQQQMMLLLALNGQRSAALRQYEVCRTTLAQEFDVEPSSETTALYERIRNGEVSVPPSRPGRPTISWPRSRLSSAGKLNCRPFPSD